MILRVFTLFYKGGYYGVLADLLKNIIIKFFTLFLSCYSLIAINWKKIFSCSNDKTCNNFIDITYKNPFNYSNWNLFVYIYFIIYLINLILNIYFL